MKLELKHLAPYLPYKLKVADNITMKPKVMNTAQGTSTHWVGIKTILNYKDNEKYFYRPILKHLTDVTFDDLERLGNRYDVQVFDGECFLFRDTDEDLDPLNWAYKDVQKLIEWHFDIFGLIEKGLAIDINDLNN